jgi:Holliday junction resolvase YEN1
MSGCVRRCTVANWHLFCAGGSNPALRTFYYRLIRLMTFCIHPIFVFDGPNKPPFKRNKRTGTNVASIPEFLAKQLLKQFGYPIHLAPGEAEAECALLQKEAIVDAVLSEDVDTLMFGSGITLRNWTPEGKSQITSHVNLFDAKETKNGPSGLDREGMILVALMSGGDYVPEGIPGCGPKIACEAARAGFGADLYKIRRTDTAAMKAWRDRLDHELRTNESKYFKTKHGTLKIPENFPDPEILGYYTHPALSTPAMLQKLRESLKWDQDIDFAALRTFTGEAFDWTNFSGAKKFIRNMAPALLSRELAIRAQGGLHSESALEWIAGVHGVRNHATTDGMTELRVSFVANDIVKIDLAAEPPDPDLTGAIEDIDDEEREVGHQGDDTSSKKRGPYLYDPTKPEKIWVMEKYVEVGSPASFNAWESALAAKTSALMAAATRTKPSRKTKSKTIDRTVRPGALDSFTIVTKAGTTTPSVCSNLQPQTKVSDLAHVQNHAPVAPASPKAARATFAAPTFSFPKSTVSNPIEILSSSPPPILPAVGTASAPLDDEDPLPSTITKRRRIPLKRAKRRPALGSAIDCWADRHARKQADDDGCCVSPARSCSTDLPSPTRLSTLNHLERDIRSPKTTKSKETSRFSSRRIRQDTHDSLLSSPSKGNINFYFTQDKGIDGDVAAGSPRHTLMPTVESVDLTMSSPSRPKKGLCTNTAKPQDTPRPTMGPAKARRRNLTSPGVSCSSSSNRSGSTGAKSLTRGSGPCLGRPSRGVKPAGLIAETNFADVLDLSETSHDKVAIQTPKEPVSPYPPPTKKQRIRIRESLAGAFAIEEIDMSAASAKKPVGPKQSMRSKTWRRSEVQTLDLTEDFRL